MSAFSVADLRSQVPPAGCQRCERVNVTAHGPAGDRTVRWSCPRGLHMQELCAWRVPTADGQAKGVPECA